MKLKDLRPEFEILVVEPVVETSENYAKILSRGGYRTQACTDPAHALNEARKQPPHIILFATLDIESSRKQLEALKKLSPEFQIILLTNKTQTARAVTLVEQEFIFDFLLAPLSSPSELIVKCDKAAEKLYLTFELEQAKANSRLVHDFSQHSDGSSYNVPPLINVAEPMPARSSTHHQFEDDILKLSMSRDPGQSITTFLQLVSDRLKGRSIGYFKFLPTHFSFIYVEGVGISVSLGKPIGVDLRNCGFRDASQVFSQLEEIPEICEMFDAVFKSPKFAVLPHALDSEPLGFFAVLGQLSAEEREHYRVLERLFSLVYQRNLLAKAKDQFETRDPLTGLTGVIHFETKLKEELSRSRRTALAVSLIVFEIDRLGELESRIGVSQVDTILKMIGVIVRKTSRSNDISGVLSRGKFALILPHTDSTGAFVRAERLRKMVGNTKFPMTEVEGMGLLTVSVALGEYPALSSDSESLVRSTIGALASAQDAGGNRVQTVKVTDDFKPDFIAQKAVSPIDLSTTRGKQK